MSKLSDDLNVAIPGGLLAALAVYLFHISYYVPGFLLLVIIYFFVYFRGHSLYGIATVFGLSGIFYWLGNYSKLIFLLYLILFAFGFYIYTISRRD